MHSSIASEELCLGKTIRNSTIGNGARLVKTDSFPMEFADGAAFNKNLVEIPIMSTFVAVLRNSTRRLLH